MFQKLLNHRTRVRVGSVQFFGLNLGGGAFDEAVQGIREEGLFVGVVLVKSAAIYARSLSDV